MKKKYFFALTLLLVITKISFSQNITYNIDDPEDLRNVIYQPGDVIILKNGVYDTDERMRFLGSGTAENPVTFRAETPGGVIFTGGPRLTIGGDSEDGVKTATGEYLIVDGFHWKGGYGASNFIEFRNGNDYAHHSTIQNCVIDGLGIEPDELAEDLADEQIPKHRWVVLYGTYNTVTNCSFMNKVSAGAIVLGEYAYNAFPPVEDGEEEINTSCLEVGHTITNNYFYNFEKVSELYGKKANGDDLSNAGDSETIRIGTSSYQMVNSNATVSNNYFVQADGENEIITNKSKGNTYTNNTFRRSRGSLVLRHGSNATVDGNFFLGENVDGTGGVRITDSGHTITNNYIQDCIAVNSNAKWNNGITFLGGNEDADIDCSSDDVSNGYQQTSNINVSNNSIVNTNAPLFYNEDKGSTDPTGTVANNLIYFQAENTNLTDVISGDSDTAFNNLGKGLTYTNNVFTGTSLGATTDGFTEETGITATANGEIFTFTGADGKGANTTSNTPISDDMVGYGIGACFTDYTGNSITDGNCTIQAVETLNISGLSILPAETASYDVTVTANVSWTAASNDDWISIDITSGTGNETVSVTVTKNTEPTNRTGTVTFTQVEGGDDLEKTLTVIQKGADLTDIYTLINTGTGLETDKVTVHSFSKENSSKDEVATNSLDKDLDTEWTADDGSILSGDYKGDGEYVIYDLGSEEHLNLIQFNTTNKSDAFGVQIWVSTTGTESSDFSMILPTSGDLLFTATNTTDFNQYQVDVDARYVKFIGFGRFNSAGDSRESAWTAVTEIEFYGPSSLSTDEYTNADELGIKFYPNPVTDKTLYIQRDSNDFNTVKIYSVIGKQVLNTKLNTNNAVEEVDLSLLNSGLYFVEINNGKQKTVKKIIIK
ncbi:chondroitinase-B domain-containing protein [Polaribacter sargassicola]|uniref:chondroitinase-B domain-containing protein n=1 Tax=Polaribacter sargassicola TaxID=2836891 RepID=UPI001F3090C7|nr:chondroitinase-B domain-containing protein [Polaribacter sp. DS7-9]MCG1036196.1 T9SS type A sorting domain-containing protein [Polaribacter sp. DS7-9]